MGKTLFKNVRRGPSTRFRNGSSMAYLMRRGNNYHNKSRGALYRTASTDPVLTFLEGPRPSKSIDGGITSYDQMQETEDLRLFHPERERNIPRTVTGNRARIIIAPRVHTPEGVTVGPLGETYLYRDPNRVLVCIRRRIRKEVAHALGWPERKFIRPPNWTSKSFVRCSDLGAEFY